MGNIFQIPKFEKMDFYSGLSVVKDSANNKLVGYVNLHPYEKAWFFFMQDFTSDFYNNYEDALRALCETYSTKRYDRAFDKAGLLNNKDYVLK